MIERILKRLHRVFNHDPAATPVMQINAPVGSTIAVSETEITVNAPQGQQVTPITEGSLTDLAAAIMSGPINAAQPNATFSRASAAYLTNGTQIASGKPRIEPGKFGGAIMVEEGTTNLFTYGNDPSNAAWIKTNCTYANQQIIPSSTANVAHYINQDKSLTSGTIYTQSIEAKAGGYSVLQIAPSTGFPMTYVNFDLINGVVSASGTEITGRITPLGNGWYRCEATVTANATMPGRMLFGLIPSPASSRLVTWTADGVSGIYVRAAQLEAKAYATSFIDGTRAIERLNVPAPNMSPTAGTIEIVVDVNAAAKRKDSVNFPVVFAVGQDGVTAPDYGGYMVLAHSKFNATWRFSATKKSTAQNYGVEVSDSLTPEGFNTFTIKWDQTNGAKLFINGVYAGATIAPTYLPDNFYSQFEIGHISNDVNRNLNTTFDSVRLSNIARTDAEILASYQSSRAREL